MKFFNWLQSKFNAGQGENRANAAPATNHKKKECLKEEFSNWHHGLLAIGTFGYEDHTSEQRITQVDQTSETKIPQENVSSLPDFSEFTAEEVWSLQKKLMKLLRAKEPIADAPLDPDEEDIDRTIRIILGRCKDVCEEKKAIGKRSLCFLMKNTFVCRSGFVATMGLRDTFQESMEKLLRTMLKKKVYPQNSSRASSTKKCAEDYRHLYDGENEEGSNDKSRDGSKWDKTDSEFIVLEV